MNKVHLDWCDLSGSNCYVVLKRYRWVFMALLLSSCYQGGSTFSDIALPELPPQFSLMGGQRPNSKSEAWWLAFNDRQLNAIVARVQRGNLTVTQARERLAAAAAIAHSASSGFLPNVGLSGSATASSSNTRVDDISRRPVQLNLETGWEIALFGQDKLAQKSADLDGRMAAEDVNAAKLSVIAEAATSYIRLRALQHQRQNADLLSSAKAKARDIATVRFRSGLATMLEAQSATDVSAAMAQQKRVLDNAIADEIQRIAVLQGVAEDDAALSVIKPQPVADKVLVKAVPADVLRQRPDVRRAEFAVLKAGAEVGIATSDLYPKLHLSGMIGIGSPVSGSIFGIMGGPSLQMPLFDYGKRLDVVEAKKAQLREAVAAYRQTVLVAHGEASSALRALLTARLETARARSAYSTAEKGSAEAQLLSREGLSDPSILVARQLAALETRRQLTDATKDEAEALIVFAKATGGSLSAEAQDIATSPDKRRKNGS
ncbi:TolC family protein [Thalassospira sp. TSL5-1]|uniref:TolC family protein n=1 Tax=Thalassospira sp. TSL5-1 TaxID=1544451 RepID=UPI001C072800|nr:TolC family protein [Thalassospira sp. TSL5-1]